MVLCLSLAGLAQAADQKVDLEKTMLTTPDGKSVPAKEMMGGKTSAVVFAQTACSNCRQEIRHLVAISEDYPKVQQIVAIVDMNPNPARIGAYLGELGFKGQVVTDPAFALASSVGVSMTPSMVMVDGGGNVTYSSIGFNEDVKKAITDAFRDVK